MSEQILQELQAIRRLTLMAAKDTFTVEEACLYLNCSESHLYNLTSGRKIAYYKPEEGKTNYFRRSDLDNYMQGRRFESDVELQEKAVAWNRKTKKGGRA